MKNFYKERLAIILVTITALSFGSCRKMIEVDPPKNQLVTSTVFSDSSDATSAMVGVYSKVMSLTTSVNFLSGKISIFTGLASDEIYTTSTNPDPIQFFNNAITKESIVAYDWWGFPYELIYHTNAIIQGLSESTTLKASVKNKILGEAKFARALIYFNLVNLYGDVPLVTNINYQESATMPRTTVANVYSQIINDLLDAQQLLPTQYISSGKLRPNQYTATALLARVYLYQKQWDKAEIEASKVINSGVYSLAPDLNNVFRNTSTESIWQMFPLQTILGVPETLQLIPFSATRVPNFPVTSTLLNAFETGDNRKVKWLNSNTIAGTIYTYPFKYKLLVSAAKDEYYVVLRLAEQYLIRAEARVQQSKISETQADLNIIRNRAGLPNTTANDQASLLSAIYQERRIELFCEWGHRWYDLKRENLINTVLSLQKPGWQATDALFPIPFSEMQLNPFLSQNPGY